MFLLSLEQLWVCAAAIFCLCFKTLLHFLVRQTNTFLFLSTEKSWSKVICMNYKLLRDTWLALLSLSFILVTFQQ